MKNFVLIDHSIKRIGGHNYEYAFHVLSAAERQGYRPIIAVNRRFFERRRLPASWQLLTPFRHTTYETAHLVSKRRRIDPTGTLAAEQRIAVPAAKSPACRTWSAALPQWVRRSIVSRYEQRKRRIIDRYTADLGDLFGQMKLARGDHIFVPTLSEDDLLGLVEFFRQRAAALSAVNWHLQFHFSVYDGRELGHIAHDDHFLRLKRLISDVQQAMPGGCIRFYTTTDILAAQYNHLGAAQFHPLPYPVNPALLDKGPSTAERKPPLRVTCAGGVRPEKGIAQLYRPVAPLWRDYFETGRLQLVVQAKRMGKLPRELRPFARFDRKPSDLNRTRVPPKVAVVRWPLSTEEYLNLVRGSDIGLLLYDAEQYYARCSGVMVEMLKAGVPVMVPAGCWMAEQIAEPIFAHRDRLCETLPVLARQTPADVDWEASGAQRYHLWRRDSRLLVGPERDSLGARLSVPDGASHVCIRFRWSAASPRGSYLDLSVHQTAKDHRHLQSSREVVGVRAAGGPASILMPLVPQTRQVQLAWRNAFSQRTLELTDLEFLFFSAETAACPLGAVGLIAADIDEAARLLRDIADNYEHYRRTAQSFAPAWGEWHSPEKVVRLLTEGHAAERQVAA